VVAIDAPQAEFTNAKENVFKNYTKSDFKCMGYIKMITDNSTKGYHGFRESFFHDKKVRFSHDLWRWKVQHGDRDELRHFRRAQKKYERRWKKFWMRKYKKELSRAEDPDDVTDWKIQLSGSLD